jgi:hypothetical protein
MMGVTFTLYCSDDARSALLNEFAQDLLRVIGEVRGALS